MNVFIGMKWLLYGLISLPLSGCGQAVPPRNLNAIVEIPFGVPSLNQTTVLSIPEGYIDRWVMGKKPRPYPELIALEASGVELLPKSASTVEDFKYPRAFTQLISINLDVGSFFTSNKLENWKKYLSGEYIVKSDACQFHEQKGLRYNLNWKKVDLISCINLIANPKQVPVNDPNPDMYFVKNNKDQIITSIWCLSEEFDNNGTYINGEKTSLNPSCHHLFFDEKTGIYLELSYSRQFLPHWQTIQNNALLLAQSFLPKN